jgi:hypothetical protein
MEKTTESELKCLFDIEASFLDRVFYNYLQLNLVSQNILSGRQYNKFNISEEMIKQEYIINICSKYCYDCSVIMTLNIFLDKWKKIINNNDGYLYYKEYIFGRILICITSLNERFDFEKISLNGEYNKYYYLCGCIDYDRHMRENISQQNETEEQIYKKISWKNDLKSHLIDLNKHLLYLKTPHNVYRNILIKLTFRLNKDCVSNIIEYL